jgi:hypothetical protein
MNENELLAAELDKNFMGGMLESIELLVRELNNAAQNYRTAPDFKVACAKLLEDVEECSQHLFVPIGSYPDNSENR